MATNFPSSLDDSTTIPVESANTKLSTNHVTAHQNIQDAIEAIETKVGANSSAVTTSHDYKLSTITGSNKAVSNVDGELTTPSIDLGSDATGDMFYRGADGKVKRLGIGSTDQTLKVTGGLPAWGTPASDNKNYVADTGSTNALVATLVPALTSYTAGVLVQVKVANTNTGATTINVNGLGAKTIKKLDGANDLVAGDLVAGQVISLEYDGTNFQMQSPVALPIKSNYQAFTSSGTWTKPSGLTGNEMVTVQLWGAGGGGGGVGVSNDSAGGGGGGSYVEAKFRASDLGSTVSVTIGAGGAGGVGANNGSVGGSSTFGSLLTAYGGGGGGYGAGSSINGGGGGGGGVTSAGSSGNIGVLGAGGGIGGGTTTGQSSDFGGGAGGYLTPFVGGASVYGGGGGGSTGNGAGGVGYYSGGGGGGGQGSGSAAAGGAGLIYGGNGGAGGLAANGSAGTAPAGGGGGAGNNSGAAKTGGAGARGECRVFVSILSN